MPYRLNRGAVSVWLLFASCVNQKPMRASSCDAPEFSEPVLIAASIPDVVLRSPSIASSTKIFAVVGNTLAFFDASPVPANPATVVLNAQSKVGTPVGAWNFAYPMLAVGRNETLHLLWGEPAPSNKPVSAQEWPEPIRNIWHSTYHAPEGWSPAEKILASRELYWAEQLNAPIASSSNGDMLVTLVATHDSSSPTPLYLFFSNGRWYHGDIAHAPTPTYVSGTFVADRAVVGIVTQLERDGGRSAVVVQSSIDHGAKWDAPTLVTIAERDVVISEIRAISRSPDALYLVWVENQRNGTSAVGSARSSDGGVTWALQRAQLGAGASQQLSATIGPNETIHALVSREGKDHLNDEVSQLYWNGEWHVVQSAFPQLRIGSHTIGISREGEPVAVIMAQRFDDSLTTRPRTYQATVRCIGR